MNGENVIPFPSPSSSTTPGEGMGPPVRIDPPEPGWYWVRRHFPHGGPGPWFPVQFYTNRFGAWILMGPAESGLWEKIWASQENQDMELHPVRIPTPDETAG
ncbi:MAG: hypothetical protein HQL51_01705 [Magnetococcales bacterium]|nr:hypothetical protein [Magnetococcales bacterium]